MTDPRPDRRRLLGAALLAAALGIAACGGTSDSGAADEPAGPAPLTPVEASAVSVSQLDFVAPVLGGGELDGTTLAGTDTIVWFWAP